MILTNQKSMDQKKEKLNPSIQENINHESVFVLITKNILKIFMNLKVTNLIKLKVHSENHNYIIKRLFPSEVLKCIFETSKRKFCLTQHFFFLSCFYASLDGGFIRSLNLKDTYHVNHPKTVN